MMRVRYIVFVFFVSLLVLGVFRVCDGHGNGRGHGHEHGRGPDHGHGHGHGPEHGNVVGLRINFYAERCPDAETIVKGIILSRVPTNPTLPAKLLRMHFHDCFVRGCDASVLLDAVNNVPAEKDSIPNSSLSGFDVIDDIKTAIENKCPGVVSCADILSLAARDAVSFQSIKNMWEVPTGRRDGRVSLASEINGNIPSPFSNFSTLLQLFINKGLDLTDLVSLSGGHTIGVAHCATFSNRLYNFTGKGDADPSLNAIYAKFLRSQCPNPANSATTVELDPGSSRSFDKNYFKILLQQKGLLQSDAALLKNGNSFQLVQRFLNSNDFFDVFAKSMVKMGAIEVLTGNAGEIRKRCRVVLDLKFESETEGGSVIPDSANDSDGQSRRDDVSLLSNDVLEEDDKMETEGERWVKLDLDKYGADRRRVVSSSTSSLDDSLEDGQVWEFEKDRGECSNCKPFGKRQDWNDDGVGNGRGALSPTNQISSDSPDENRVSLDRTKGPKQKLGIIMNMGQIPLTDQEERVIRLPLTCPIQLPLRNKGGGKIMGKHLVEVLITVELDSTESLSNEIVRRKENGKVCIEASSKRWYWNLEEEIAKVIEKEVELGYVFKSIEHVLDSEEEKRRCEVAENERREEAEPEG
ncbi:hypothetical protein LWI29_026182 [Acer saccharum]|uniref:peroxidase n=1 Tax=Acer saccharum TaxID=4024 RepID=A0AA39SZB2_ACESA|nr:hypothetical protein LWI29_026182 [Acer saccharum]